MSTPELVSEYGGVDLSYRPPHYVADWCPTAVVVQNIGGEVRREVVHQYLAAGSLRADMPTWFMADVLPPARREALVARDPVALAPGEYLPRFAPREQEIARVVIATMPKLVFSLRGVVVRPVEFIGVSGDAVTEPVWRYRLVGDGGRTAQLPHSTSWGTLPLRGVIAVLDAARLPGLDDAPDAPPKHYGLAERLLYWRWRDEHDAAVLRRFVRVSSVVYPTLATYYRERLRQYVAGRLSARGDRVSYAPPLDRALEMAWGQR